MKKKMPDDLLKIINTIPLHELVSFKLKHFFDKLGPIKSNGLYGKIITQIEKPLIQLTLEKTNNNRCKAAQILGLNRNTLRSKIKDLNIRINT